MNEKKIINECEKFFLNTEKYEQRYGRSIIGEHELSCLFGLLFHTDNDEINVYRNYFKKKFNRRKTFLIPLMYFEGMRVDNVGDKPDNDVFYVDIEVELISSDEMLESDIEIIGEREVSQLCSEDYEQWLTTDIT